MKIREVDQATEYVETALGDVAIDLRRVTGLTAKDWIKVREFDGLTVLIETRDGEKWIDLTKVTIEL